jgi:hypothetical protein
MVVPDKLFINLKIIGKIQKNGRLKKSHDGVVSLDKNWYLQGLWRSLSSDSRKQTIYEINNIINELPIVLDAFRNSKYLSLNYRSSDELTKLLEEFKMLVEALKEAELGLENLKFTYIRDDNITAQMDIIIFRMSTIVKDASQMYASAEECRSDSFPMLSGIV